jgi:hypothetical protein
MNKYVAPTIQVVNVKADDIILTSGVSVSIKPLEGVDKGDDKSAIFNADFWFKSK